MKEMFSFQKYLDSIKPKFTTINKSYDVLYLWNELFDEKTRNNITPIKFDKNILYVTVKSNIWLQQIQFLKSDIISKYKERDESIKIIDIKATLNKNAINKEHEKEVKLQEIKKIELLQLSEEEKQDIINKTSNIPDEKIRKSLIKSFEFSLRKEKTLKAQQENK